MGITTLRRIILSQSSACNIGDVWGGGRSLGISCPPPLKIRTKCRSYGPQYTYNLFIHNMMLAKLLHCRTIQLLGYK